MAGSTAETPASEVFEELPELESIHGGALVDGEAPDDAELVEQLQAGRGYWFRISDGDAVDWVRRATPAGRRFQLEPGRQLVAWRGARALSWPTRWPVWRST